MSDGLDSLLELIERAQAIADGQARSTISYFLSVAADSALEERRLEAARCKPANILPFKRQQWKWGRGLNFRR